MFEVRPVSSHWSDSTKRLVVVQLVLAIALAAYRFNSILLPVIIAVIIAYILTPVVDALNRRTPLPRSLCVLLVDLLALILVGSIPAVVAPIFVSELRQVNLDMQALMESILQMTDEKWQFFGMTLDLSSVYEQLARSLEGLVQPIVSSSIFFLWDIVTGLLWTVFVFFVSFYLMRDWHRVTNYLHTMVPPAYRHDYEQITIRIGRIWQSFFRGQVMLSAVVGLAVTVAMAVEGVSNALVLGLLAGLLESIPNVGPVIAAVPAVILALLQGSSWIPLGNFWFAVVVAGTYIVIQQIENNYLVPRIIGGSVNLHPLVVLIGAIAGARLAGVLGIFLAAPVLATLRLFLGYIYAKLLDVEPFPVPPVVQEEEEPEVDEEEVLEGDLL